MKQMDVDEIDSISTLAVLKEFYDVCDSIGIHKGVATWLVSYFIKKPA